MSDFEQMETLMAKLQRSIAARPSPKRLNQNSFIRATAIEIGFLAPGVEYWIVLSPMSDEIKRMRQQEASGDLPPGFCASIPSTISCEGALNGYVAFPKRHAPLIQRSMGGILDYIPVHGGVTYAVKDQTACVYGFDTLHYDSESVPRTERPWIAWQCRILYESILFAAKIERNYLRAVTEPQRARILQPLLDLVPEQDLSIGAILRLLTGEL